MIRVIKYISEAFRHQLASRLTKWAELFICDGIDSAPEQINFAEHYIVC